MVGVCEKKWGQVGRRSNGVPCLAGTRERMFLGQYKYTIDSKGRLTIPVRFRAALFSGAFITQGFDRNLNVFTAESFERLAGRATAVTSTNPEARTMRRLIFSRAQELPLDAPGRVLLPPFPRDDSGTQAGA